MRTPYLVVKLAYTAADLQSVEVALREIAVSGVAELTDAMGNRIRYHSIADLLRLKQIMEADLSKSNRSGIDLMNFGGPR